MSRSARGPTLPTRTCRICGREFTWRKKWQAVWDEVTHCSTRCRRRRLDPTDHALERAILDLLARRGADKTICPSEAPRSLHDDESDWRPLLPSTRDAARRLAARGRIEFLQRGRVISPTEARGAVRLRSAPPC